LASIWRSRNAIYPHTATALLGAAFACGSAFGAAAQPFPPAPSGIYGCIGSLATGTAVSPYRDARSQTDAYSAVWLTFGLLDGSSYANFDGDAGHYTYSAAKGVLTMVDGPLKGLGLQAPANVSRERVGARSDAS